MIIRAWGGNFSNLSLSDIDESAAIERQLNDMEVSEFSGVVGDLFDARASNGSVQRNNENRRRSAHRIVTVQKPSKQNLWDPNVPYMHLCAGSLLSRQRDLFHNQRVTSLLQRGLVLLHLGRWAESATM